MCNGKCGSVPTPDRVTAVLSGLASNPEFIRTVERRYGNGNEAASMKEIATALLQVADYIRE